MPVGKFPLRNGRFSAILQVDYQERKPGKLPDCKQTERFWPTCFTIALRLCTSTMRPSKKVAAPFKTLKRFMQALELQEKNFLRCKRASY
jgi:hypothetical protein